MKQRGDVVVQRVHVLHQPLVGFVIHLEEAQAGHELLWGHRLSELLKGHGEPWCEHPLTWYCHPQEASDKGWRQQVLTRHSLRGCKWKPAIKNNTS